MKNSFLFGCEMWGEERDGGGGVTSSSRSGCPFPLPLPTIFFLFFRLVFFSSIHTFYYFLREALRRVTSRRFCFPLDAHRSISIFFFLWCAHRPLVVIRRRRRIWRRLWALCSDPASPAWSWRRVGVPRRDDAMDAAVPLVVRGGGHRYAMGLATP
jgi:hypothetical protein